MIDEDQIAEMQLKFPDDELHLLSAAGEEVIAKPPSAQVWKQFRTYGMDKERRVVAAETLVRNCIVFPDAVGLKTLLEKKPGLADAFAGQLVKIAGAVEDAESKKL